MELSSPWFPEIKGTILVSWMHAGRQPQNELLFLSMQMRRSVCWLMSTVFSEATFAHFIESSLTERKNKTKQKIKCSSHRKLASLVQQVAWVAHILQHGPYNQQCSLWSAYIYIYFYYVLKNIPKRHCWHCDPCWPYLISASASPPTVPLCSSLNSLSVGSQMPSVPEQSSEVLLWWNLEHIDVILMLA